MKLLAILFMLGLLQGCTLTPVLSPTPPALLRQMSSNVAAPPTVHVFFMVGTNWPESDDWTNYYTFTALVATNLEANFTNWNPLPVTLELYQGHLAFELDASQPQLFCAGRFTPIQ